MGSGGFTCSDVSTDGNKSFGVALGFVDGDANLDAVFTNQPFQRDRVCLGDGLGGFTCNDVSTEENRSFGVALEFVDGDANLDAVFANFAQRNRVCLGDGLGGFSCNDVSTDANRSFGLALEFVDGDANLDAVFANFGDRNRVCLGDGLGGFTCSDVSTDGNLSIGVALAPGGILPPRLPFAAFDIEKAEAEEKEKLANDEFEIKGSFALGEDSDGFDLSSENVIVTFDGFTETIPAGSFLPFGDDEQGLRFKGEKGGVTKVTIRDDGRFEVKAKGLDLSGIDFENPVPFSLQLGDEYRRNRNPV